MSCAKTPPSYKNKQKTNKQTNKCIWLRSHHIFKELGQRTKPKSGDSHSFQFLIQRVAVTIQQGNTAAVLGTLPAWLFNCVLLFGIFFRCIHLSFKCSTEIPKKKTKTKKQTKKTSRQTKETNNKSTKVCLVHKVKFLALELDHACILCREQRMAHFSLYKPVDSSTLIDTARKGLKIVLSVGDTFCLL